MSEPLDLRVRIERLESELARLKNRTEPPVNKDSTAPPPAECASLEPIASRRDLLRYGAAALSAVAASGVTASAAHAADGGPVILGATNTATSGTTITSTQTAFAAVSTGQSPGLYASGYGYGIYAEASAPNAAAVQGWTYSGTAAGVRGNSNSPNGVGVHGMNAAGGTAVLAEIPAASSVNAIAMYALNYSTYTGGGPGAGGFAIYGLSARGHGLVGATAAAGAAAVVGATNGVAGAYAAAFYGPVIVSGNFTVVGGAKSAAVPHPDGSHRRMYCLESPESWFEDFGRGTLACGEALVLLDPDFVAVVNAADYHVFLTAYDSDAYLNVLDRSATGFRVRASEGVEGVFSWRVVAKRKDIAGPRFEPVEIPKEPPPPPVPGAVDQEMLAAPAPGTIAGASQLRQRKA